MNGERRGAEDSPERKPLVSIVVTNFNYARYLSRSIESALAQTWPLKEVVVVDDASTDRSTEVINRYSSDVTPVLKSQNGGQAAAMNSGFEVCRGELVIFLDADDYLYPHAVSAVVAAWSRQVALVQYRLNLVDAQGQHLDTFPSPEVSFDHGNVVPQLVDHGRFEATVTSGLAFSRQALETILPIPESEFRISADGYLITVAPFAGPVVSLDEPLGAYRQHGGNVWSNTLATGQKFRRLLAHDATRYRALRSSAARRGLTVAAQPGLRDHRHLANRMASLCVDPLQHPTPSDSRLKLAAHGLWASRRARLPRRRRVVLGGWFVISALLPRRLAGPWTTWYLDKRSRPHFVQRLVSALRKLTS